ncbi:Phycocyanobilin lyase subunit alpha [Gracilariopsis chorda]|uniref:Phycocyanobilin lyase subunit alpha n=1 Tax=Gracilariopsis chorda TaxID=448386 RepID=A0A2V3ISD0_9FLOR|nr:Phycocyanobilin lyase subunit alpha [Gracilariopsis chorda]|eukprot:PXF45038.1 Phycocyanobilin lyase subunit alpha [Gracilariopsis chorda]
MFAAFVHPIQITRGPVSTHTCRKRYSAPRAVLPHESQSSLYSILGLRQSDLSTVTSAQIRRAYLELAKETHPDTSQAEAPIFDQISKAYAILSDPELRSIYDESGHEGLAAVASIKHRAEQIRDRFSSMSGEQLDFLSDTGELVGGLLSSATDEDAFDPSSVSHEDACPRSVEEAIWNIQFHPDRSVRYYGLWWIYKFKVKPAEAALVNVLQTSNDQTSLGGFGIRRRAALALGAVASAPTEANQAAAVALSDALRSPDYFLRYRAAEAIANIAQRCSLLRQQFSFPKSVTHQLKLLLLKGQKTLDAKAAAKSGFKQQESLFDLEKLDPLVREKLEAVFRERRENEKRSRRTTMTPQLGVDAVGSSSDEPYEWLLKAVSAICAKQRSHLDDQLLEVIESYTSNSVPLVRYAAHKALYALTGADTHAEQIVRALGYGVEHHYSQRVLIRDLGDLGYSKGAEAVALCPMVENSFKILALKNMLAKQKHDPSNREVRNVLSHMDSLL